MSWNLVPTSDVTTILAPSAVKIDTELLDEVLRRFPAFLNLLRRERRASEEKMVKLVAEKAATIKSEYQREFRKRMKTGS